MCNWNFIHAFRLVSVSTVTGNWVNWSSEKIPNRMTPDNRRQAREESYAEQQDKLQLAKEDAWKRQEDSKHKR